MIRSVTDLTAGTAAATMPLWVMYLQGWLTFATAAGGFALVLIRLAIAWREWRSRNSGTSRWW